MISIIIPTKNESFINQLVQELHSVLVGISHEIIVVDKSSLPPVIADARLIIQKSDGLGKAVLEGLDYARGDVIVTMDGDGSHRPVDVLKLLDKINSCDIVIGSRFVSGGITKDATHRKLISFVFRKFASLVLGFGIKDSMSGFAAIKKEVYENLRLNPLGYKINMEIIYKGKKQGYKVCEVPILFEERKLERSKSGIREAFRVFRYIFELKLGLR